MEDSRSTDVRRRETYLIPFMFRCRGICFVHCMHVRVRRCVCIAYQVLRTVQGSYAGSCTVRRGTHSALSNNTLFRCESSVLHKLKSREQVLPIGCLESPGKPCRGQPDSPFSKRVPSREQDAAQEESSGRLLIYHGSHAAMA
jgi:hypothetical protein